MKRQLKSLLCLCLTVLMMLTLCACFHTVDKTGVWENAIYRRNMELGKGAKTVEITFTAEEQSIVFTIHTDGDTLADALVEENLIEAEESAYGLYVTAMNGIPADNLTYYFAFYQGGDYLMTGISSTAIADGDRYEIVYEKIGW